MSDVNARAVVSALVAGMREVLGTFAKPRMYGQAAAHLEAQLRSLAPLVPGVHAAARDMVEERVRHLVTSDEAAQSVLTHPVEPNHAFYLLLVSDATIRRTAAHWSQQQTEPPTVQGAVLKLPPGFLGGAFGPSQEDD